MGKYVNDVILFGDEHVFISIKCLWFIKQKINIFKNQKIKKLSSIHYIKLNEIC
jgi:hypothetical protein